MYFSKVRTAKLKGNKWLFIFFSGKIELIISMKKKQATTEHAITDLLKQKMTWAGIQEVLCVWGDRISMVSKSMKSNDGAIPPPLPIGRHSWITQDVDYFLDNETARSPKQSSKTLANQICRALTLNHSQGTITKTFNTQHLQFQQDCAAQHYLWEIRWT